MNIYKLQLLAATAAVSAIGGTAALAQSAFPAATLYGAGASLPQTIVRQASDCYGLRSDLGFGVSAPSTAPAAQSIFDFDFNTPAADTIGNRFNCAGNSANAPIAAPNFGDPRIVQPNIQVLYVSTGSGTGINSFLKGQLFGASSSSGSTTVVINLSAGFPANTSTTGYQYSLSDTPLSSGNVNTFKTVSITPYGGTNTGTAEALFGPAIQVPLAIAPVALAYDPVYAKVRNNDASITQFRFRIPVPRADGSGGLKLTRAQYCGIINGVITNFNQLPTTVVNKDAADPAVFSVPIKLVGRSESSGTTSLFTRAIAAQCTGLSVANGVGGTGTPVAITNKFVNSEGLLPRPASAISPTNSLSGAVFDKATDTLSGTETAGLFGVANGNDGVAEYVNLHVDPTGTAGDRSLNGRFGYLSPENALPATLFNGSNTFGLNTASLQVNGTGTVFAAPDAKQAVATFVGIAPPQSKGTAGAYCTSGCTGAGSGVGDRANPLDWVQIADKSVSLAAPIKGYPIVGTTNLLFYTCYATPERRRAVDGWIATLMGKTTKDHNNQPVSAALNVDALNGLYSKNALSPMPAAWRTAITETFLKNSVQVGVVGDPTTKLGLRNLWVQDKIPTTPTGAGSVTAGNTTICAGKPGA